MDHIGKDSILVYLDTPLEIIESRMHKMKVDRIVGQSSNSLRDILRYRQNFYENKYDIRIMTTEGEDVQTIADRILKELRKDQNYGSTRGWKSETGNTEFLDVIRMGLAPDRGLFVAPEWTPFTLAQLGRMIVMPYEDRVLRVFERFPLGSHCPPPLLRDLISSAYSTFDNPKVLPVTHLEKDQYLMEMYHGPTASFKDLSLQLTPKLLSLALSNTGNEKIGLLVATSGDTGTAALDGFGREKGIPVVVLYPNDGVSSIQKAQMTTAPDNTLVLAVNSDFDYCQTLVKDILEQQHNIFNDMNGMSLTSANSINFGRFLPQVAFTVSAYLDLIRAGRISLGEEIDVTVPTGNFGNILGVIMARRLGIPIGRIVCASNTNNVLTDFLTTGHYDLHHRTFTKTISPSIDILLSSNVERFIHLLYKEHGTPFAEIGRNITDHFNTLAKDGEFHLPPDIVLAMENELTGGWCSEDQCRHTIRRVKDHTDVTLDPHTAVAKFVADFHSRKDVPMLIASTASFAKFPEAIISSLRSPDDRNANGDLAQLFSRVADAHNPVPPSLNSLLSKKVNHSITVNADKDEIINKIKAYLQRQSL